MPSMEDWLIQAFQDKPVGQARLDSLQDSIMGQILSEPVDFLNQQILAKRRRWGLLFAGSWLGLGLAVLLLMIINGQAILNWIIPVFGDNILANLKLLVALKAPLMMLWQEYSWQLTGLSVIMVVLVRGFRVNSPLPQPEEAEQG